MGDFKRGSSRFSRGGSSGGSSSGSSSGGQRSYGGSSRSGGYNRGGQQSEGRSSGYNNRDSGGEKKYPFSRIGTLRVPKSASDDMADYIHNELKGSDIKLNAQIYLGKGDESITLKSGDILLVTFKPSEKDQDFVVGTVSVKN